MCASKVGAKVVYDVIQQRLKKLKFPQDVFN
jgi:hypothetical protein